MHLIVSLYRKNYFIKPIKIFLKNLQILFKNLANKLKMLILRKSKV